jgi:micrococcal nuclease
MKRKYLYIILGLLILAVLVGCPAPAQAPDLTPTPPPSLPPSPTLSLEEQATVIRVKDGDTIVVDIAGIIYDVRYIGVDTPEMTDERPEFYALAQEATRLNRQLVEGEIVQLEKDVSEVDKYDRLLRYVYVDDTFVNAELVRQGLAWAKAYEPDIKYQSYFEELEAEARGAGLGIWAVYGE